MLWTNDDLVSESTPNIIFCNYIGNRWKTFQENRGKYKKKERENMKHFL